MTDQYLFLFQIGPVQSFIAAARKTQDLYVGSRLLSVIAGAGAEAAHQAHWNMLFPVTMKGAAPQTTPHRFAFLSGDDPAAVAEHVAEALQARWMEIANAVSDYVFRAVGGGDWVDVFQRQVNNWLEVHWVAVPYTGGHGEVFAAAGRALAMRRLSRTFAQPSDDAPGAKKCTLTGAGRALPLNWDALRRAIHDDPADPKFIRANEELSALALIKRLAQKVPSVSARLGDKVERFPDADYIAGGDGAREAGRGKELTSYLAILHMDGDKMGKHLAGLQSAKAHQAFSSMLSRFAEVTVPKLVEKYPRAALVYAGGDDVLALAPLQTALNLADDIRKAFKAESEEIGEPLTMSAGIAAAPSNLPFDAVLQDARLAEKTAKKKYDRDAVVIRESHRSGQIREAGARWDHLDPIIHLQVLFAEDALSGKLGYDLLTEARWLAGDGLEDARKAELGRLLKRRTGDGVHEAVRRDIENLQGPLTELGEKHSWEAMANWVIVAHFLAKGGAR
ncbi:MAG: type III-B CRISPR-associated protein Cas10/Cmr2 [Anaerolineae bacterium]|nr:type III-B CRISPR-associated protein Cas10/Cmr2 [Anaerolineae bacterium]